MKRLTFIFLTVALMSGMAGSLMAQSDTHQINVTVDGIALLRVNDGNAITLQITAPATEGDSTAVKSNATNYLQYTSIRASGVTKKVTAATDVAVPAGLSLLVTAAAPTTGAGTRGTSGGRKALSTSASDVITGIGSCYTGIGATDGGLLTYQLFVNNWTNVLSGGPTAVTVTYTLTN